MFLIYIPRIAKEANSACLLKEIIKFYTKGSNYSPSIVCSPGYLSMSEQSIKNYYKELGGLFSGKPYIALLNGVNGNWKKKENNKSIYSINNEVIKKEKYFKWIELDINRKADHRKTMIFFDAKESNLTDKINSRNFGSSFLEKIDVNAVLIGSSNQSNHTYFSEKLNKGEADVMMIAETSLKEDILNHLKNFKEMPMKEYDFLKETVISQDIYIKGNKDEKVFLKSIAGDILKTGLE